MTTLTQSPPQIIRSTQLRLAFMKVFGLAFVAASWILARNAEPRTKWTLLLIAGVPFLQFPITLLGRRALDAHPDTVRAQWASLFVHYGEMIVLGVSIFPAIRIVQEDYLHQTPFRFPPIVGQVLMTVTGFAAAFTVLNLAIRGLGLPFAAKLSSRLATDWMYGWTRNPMGLCTFAFLFSVGVRYWCMWFLIVLLVCLTPGWIFFVRYFEERELEIRFGAPYVAYRAATPMFWPRKPRQICQERARGGL